MTLPTNTYIKQHINYSQTDFEFVKSNKPIQKKEYILYRLLNKELIEVKRYAYVFENSVKLQKFCKTKNRDLFLEGNTERYFFKPSKEK